MKSSLLSLVFGLALCSCAAPPVWVKDGPSDFDGDKAFCEYEAQKAIQSPSAGLKTMIGQEYDIALRRRDLAFSCMRMRGWRAT